MGPDPSTSVGRPEQMDLQSASTGELVSRLSSQISDLVRAELALARDELRAKGTRLGTGAGLAGGAGVLAVGGMLALLASVIAALALLVPVWAAALIVGVVLLAVAGVLAMLGRRQIKKATPPVPEQALQGVQRDASAIKHGLRGR